MPITSHVGHADRQFFVAGSSAEKALNYSRAVKDGDFLFISNTSGYHYDENRIDESVEGQAVQMVKNITKVLELAGGSPKDMVRVIVHCPNPQDIYAVKDVLAEFLDQARPAATIVCTPLAAPHLKIEMEVTARLTSHA